MVDGQAMDNAANHVVVELKSEQENVIVQLQHTVVMVVLVLREIPKHVTPRAAQVSTMYFKNISDIISNYYRFILLWPCFISKGIMYKI